MEKMESLEQIFTNYLCKSDDNLIPLKIRSYISIIADYCEKRKGVYTVLTTLLFYKYLHPEQDIRYFQTGFDKGFSARSFDTKYVTPVLNKLKLPAMAESGWLTRSMEQPYPYDLNYKGKIDKNLKNPFLLTLDYIEKNPDLALNCLCFLLKKVKKFAEQNKVEVIPLANPDKLSIEKIMKALEEHFLTKYNTHNGAKLPVLAFHSIYTILIKEISRYKNCKLQSLSSLTACDRTNKASGDIEIFSMNNSLYEAIEIKLDKQIDSQIMRVVENKIYKWNPQRYYVLSVYGIKDEDRDEIEEISHNIAVKHGCQVIINGLLTTIKYYLRLISNLSEFMMLYSKEVEQDTELQKIHKDKWNEIIKKYDL